MRVIYLPILILLSSAVAFSQQGVKPYAPELFSNKTSGAVCGFSNDGKTIYFVREDTIKDKLFIYEANRMGNKWSNEKLLAFSGVHNDMGGRLSPDGNKFYFTSDRPGGSSRADDVWNIWVSDRSNSGWTEAKPLTSVNDKGSECCPVPMKDGSMLFSSDRGKPQEWWMFSIKEENESYIPELTYENGWQWPSSFIESENALLFNSMKRPDTKGMDDIYISFFKNEKWTTPQNIGSPVNTEIYEDGAILSHDKKLLIFNQHATGATPSQVMCVEWKPILKGLKNAVASRQP